MGRAKTSFPNLPPRMLCRQRGDKRYYYYASKVGDKREEIPLGSILKYAKIEYNKLAGLDSAITFAMPPKFPESLLAHIRSNAKTRGIEMNLDLASVVAIFERAGGACELTGIRFDFQPMEGQRVRPWIPSVDRIDSAKPYNIDNCRLVCAAVNSALNQFGEEVLLVIASGILRNKTGRTTRHLRNEAPTAELSDTQHARKAA